MIFNKKLCEKLSVHFAGYGEYDYVYIGKFLFKRSWLPIKLIMRFFNFIPAFNSDYIDYFVPNVVLRKGKEYKSVMYMEYDSSDSRFKKHMMKYQCDAHVLAYSKDRDINNLRVSMLDGLISHEYIGKNYITKNHILYKVHQNNYKLSGYKLAKAVKEYNNFEKPIAERYESLATTSEISDFLSFLFDNYTN